MDSLEDSPTLANAYVQTGDLFFALVSMARNQGWDLEDLIGSAIGKVQRRREERHYYEAHVTIEPVFEERLETFKVICRENRFHVAQLLMKKRASDTEERSSNDSFCTGRGTSYADLEGRMLALVLTLKERGFKVWRYKIESTLLDSRYDDTKLPLDKEGMPEKERNPKAPADGAEAGRRNK